MLVYQGLGVSEYGDSCVLGGWEGDLRDGGNAWVGMASWAFGLAGSCPGQSTGDAEWDAEAMLLPQRGASSATSLCSGSRGARAQRAGAPWAARAAGCGVRLGARPASSGALLGLPPPPPGH